MPGVQDHNVTAEKPPRNTFRWIRSAAILVLCIVTGSYVVSYLTFGNMIEELRETREALPTLVSTMGKQVTSIHTEVADIHTEMKSLESSLEGIEETLSEVQGDLTTIRTRTKGLKDTILREMKNQLKDILKRIEELESGDSVINNESNNRSQDASQTPQDVE